MWSTAMRAVLIGSFMIAIAGFSPVRISSAADLSSPQSPPPLTLPVQQKNWCARIEVGQNTSGMGPAVVGGRHLAFPGAQGHGAFAKGGRGGRVVHVTSLSDDGPGSLRAALAEPGPKTILFEVGGIIDLQDTLVVPSETTIMGQTAPGDGVCLRGASLAIRGDDVVIRFVCSRPGNTPGKDDLDDRDAFQILNARNVILDHVSAGWSVDEAVSTWSPNVENVTIQNSIITEALRDAGHGKGDHSMGLLIGDGSKNISVIRNLLAHNDWRNPRIQSSDGVDVVNNLIYNWGSRATHFADGGTLPETTSANIVNNVYIRGPSSPDDNGFIVFERTLPGSDYFFSGNTDQHDNPLRPEQGYVKDQGAWNALRSTPARPIENIDVLPATQVIDSVLSDVGANRPRLNAVDARIIATVRDGTGGVLSRPGGMTYAAGRADPDSDGDGLPDAWEQARGLDEPGRFDANDDRDGDSWSNLDEFLFERANQKSTFDGCGTLATYPADIVTDVTEASALQKIVDAAGPGDAVYIVGGTNAALEGIKVPAIVSAAILSRAETIVAEDNDWDGIRQAFGRAACGNTIIIPVGNLGATRREVEGKPQPPSQAGNHLIRREKWTVPAEVRRPDPCIRVVSVDARPFVAAFGTTFGLTQ
jgi:hypothetical protein